MSRLNIWLWAIAFASALGIISLRWNGGRTKSLASVFPDKSWEHMKPEQLGMSDAKLIELRDFVKGTGIVIRHGYRVFRWGVESRSHAVFSASKPVFSTLLMMAIQDGKIKGPDEPAVDFEPQLRNLNGGKDAGITWRHLASQTSGYGLAEKPGEAFAYNDFAIALYVDTLLHKVFQSTPTDLLVQKLGEPLGFQDKYQLVGPNQAYVENMLSISAQDFARFGLLILHEGKWKDKQIVRADLVRMMLHSPVPASLPRSSGRTMPMLPDQTSFGMDTVNDTEIGPGIYSFNWWLNKPDAEGRRMLPSLPEDTCMALGVMGNALLIIPSLDMVVVWIRANADDALQSLSEKDTDFKRAARLLRESVVDVKQ